MTFRVHGLASFLKIRPKINTSDWVRLEPLLKSNSLQFSSAKTRISGTPSKKYHSIQFPILVRAPKGDKNDKFCRVCSESIVSLFFSFSHKNRKSYKKWKTIESGIDSFVGFFRFCRFCRFCGFCRFFFQLL